MEFDNATLKAEADRLYDHLKKVDWSYSDCEVIAPLTLEINRIKKEKNAVILAHSYQRPDIIFGVSDFSGDSLGLSREAAKTDADMILFAGVVFMAETAKILSPDKIVIVPSVDAGCSLADAITGEDVKQLRAQHPGVPVVAYINTNADVKAEVDFCVTSANVIEIVQSIESDKIIFVPDKNMANYIRKETGKEIIDWEGKCIVHEEFQPQSIFDVREMHKDIIVIAHSECPPEVLDVVDIVGGTSDMKRFIENNPNQKKLFLVTECGLSDRFAVEYPDREFYGTCSICPYMKKNDLKKILDALVNPADEQIITLDEDLRIRAKKSIDRMLEF
ncbi:MAG: quinolinate synthase NadA [Candidatus Heimdallarchaeota archaeon]|nr:quinolinate synthase NadA [Candidatus Heimdallarchaeota archaeon]